jgi:hypothetical protein
MLEVNDAKATWSLALGILSLVCLGIFAGIPAIILGHISRANIRRSMGRLKGDGLALAGLVMGYLNVGLTLSVFIIAAIAIPNLIRARISANEASAASTVRTLIAAETSYQANNPKVGYAADIATLGSDAGSVAENCSSNTWCTKSGYEFMLQADEQEPHQVFVITATPTKTGETGNKNFCAINDSVIRYENVTSKRPMAYTAEECAALKPLGSESGPPI